MININEIFNNDDITKNACLWLGNAGDATDLAGAAEYAAEMNIPILSVVPSDVGIIWPWVEKLRLKIISRFEIDGLSTDSISSVAVNIQSAFKQGADGAQLFVKLSDLEHFVAFMLPVRNDLFFNKDLSIALDVFNIWPMDWGLVFDSLRKLHAAALLLVLTHDDGDKSDFTGRIYGALQAWDADKNMELHVMLGESFYRAEQVYRLVAANRPDLLNRLKFFVSY